MILTAVGAHAGTPGVRPGSGFGHGGLEVFQPGQAKLSYFIRLPFPQYRSRAFAAEGRKCTALVYSVAAAAVQPAAERRSSRKPGGSRPERMEEKMKMISHPNWRLTRSELTVVLPKIACELPTLAEGSIELNNAHANPARRPKNSGAASLRPR